MLKKLIIDQKMYYKFITNKIKCNYIIIDKSILVILHNYNDKLRYTYSN